MANEREDAASQGFDLDHLVQEQAVAGDSSEDTKLILKDIRSARKFIQSQPWCDGIDSVFWGGGIGGVVSVSLIHFKTTIANAYPWVWVITGDLPSACIRADKVRYPMDALRDYVDEMNRWIVSARYSLDMPGVMQIGVPATLESAVMLQKRIDFINAEIIMKNYRLLPG